MKFKTINEGGMKQTLVYALAGLVLIVIIFNLLAMSSLTGRQINEIDSVKVGVVAPLTGDAASYGIDIQRAIEIAREDFAAENIEVEVIYEDACVAQDALKSASKLVLVDEVDLISGVFCIIAVQPISTRTKPLKITQTMSAAVPDVIIESDSYVFSPNAAMEDEAKAQAAFVFNELEARTASVVWMHTDFGITYSKYFAQRFEELGGEVLSNEPLELFGRDYRTELSKVKDENPDVLLGVHFGNQMALILKQSNELGLESQIIGTYESEDQKILDVAGASAEGLILSTPVGGSFGENFAIFEEKYIERYGEEPTVVARMAYDGFQIQVEAHEACKGERDCIIENLGKVRDYNGGSGIFSINSRGTADRVFSFKTVEGGKYVPYAY